MFHRRTGLEWLEALACMKSLGILFGMFRGLHKEGAHPADFRFEAGHCSAQLSLFGRGLAAR